ncbi:MAG: galactitol-1-phosphate 5-dehydrogenase [Defluviitaleaceae bacterium]|nr:galactitol-1-phosphate 5-dehydrogenase [Defluviitaleaceae bacterium]
MKAAILYGDGDVRFGEWPEPKIGPGEVKIRVRAAGICGSDIPRVFRGGAHYYPIVLGHEFSGDIVEVGEGVGGFEVGDKAAGAPLLPCLACGDCLRGDYALCKNYGFIGSRQQGAFAEYVALPARNAVKIDSSVPYEHAAMLEPSTVALHGLRLNKYAGGKTVAVLGAGTIGLFTVMWAKDFGAKSVTAFDISGDRLNLAKELGADGAVNAAEEGFITTAIEQTGGKGYDYVFETAGSVASMKAAFELAANKAGVCFIGTPHEKLEFAPRLWESMNRKEFSLTGSWMSYSAPFPGEEWTLAAHGLMTGRAAPPDGMIYKTFPLERCGEAFALFSGKSGVPGKIMLKGK